MEALLGGLVGGLADLASLPAMLLLLVGMLAGIVFGVIPGLGGIVLTVMLLPFLYNMQPLLALTLLLGAHSAIYYAASTTSILVNTPGAPEAAATCLDGYAMTRKGMVARALGISAAATTFGGWFGAIAFVAAIPIMLFLVTLFHPPEFFFLTILAVVMIGQMQAWSVTKGILSGLCGFMISFVGDAPSTGVIRYGFGNLSLYNGFSIAVVAIGLFAIAEMFLLFGSHRRISLEGGAKLAGDMWSQVGQGIRDVFGHLWLTVRSAAIGVLCGIIPGIGSTAANFLSYGQAMRSSKHPELFGTGIPEGVIAPEGSSIAKEAGALIPTVALGIPQGPGMAVLLSAFAIVGLEPGPTMLTEHLSLVYAMVWVLAISSLFGSVLGLALAPALAKIAVVPGRVLVPFIFALTMIGAYATADDMFQVGALIFFGIVGLVMRRYGYSLPAVIVGLVLGTVAENNVVLTAHIFGWSFIGRPLTDVIILAIVLIILAGVRRSRHEKLRAARAAGGAESPTAAAAAGPPPAPVPPQELLVDALWVAVSAGYVAYAIHFPPPSNIAPMLIGGGALVTGIIQLVGAFVPGMRATTHGSKAPSLFGPPPEAVEDRPASEWMDAGPVRGIAPPVLAAEGQVPGRQWAAEPALYGPPPDAAEAGVPSEWVAAGPAGPAGTAPGAVAPPSADETPKEAEERREQWIAAALCSALFVIVLLFGYVVGVIAFLLYYFRFVHRIDARVMFGTTAAMGILTYVIIYQVIGAVPPAGLVYHVLGLGFGG